MVAERRAEEFAVTACTGQYAAKEKAKPQQISDDLFEKTIEIYSRKWSDVRSSVEQIVDASVSQVTKEVHGVVRSIPQESIQQRVVEEIVEDKPRIQEQMVEVGNVAVQERVSEQILGLIGNVPRVGGDDGQAA